MKEIILSHRMERDELLGAQYVPREGLEEARRSLSDSIMKVVIGPRRAGKSVFCIQVLRGKDFAYLNFDDERLLGLGNYDDIIKGIKEVYGDTRILLFDEIQNLGRWELFVNRLHRRGYNILLTGSNSRLLSRELSTHLTGRYVQFQILPFSFSEFLKAKGLDTGDAGASREKQGLILHHLGEFIERGGFPEVVLRHVGNRDYLKFMTESVLFKDVVKRYNVRYSQKLYDLALYLLNNHSSQFSSTKLKNVLGFRSVHTVENYISYLEDSFLAFTLSRFSFKLKEQIRSPRKIYAFDSGIIQAFKFRLSPDIGRLMENVAAVELARRAGEFYYYKTPRGLEVDFVLKEGAAVSQLVQVCYGIESGAVREREYKPLLAAAAELGCRDLLVVTWNAEGEEKYRNVRVKIKPLWKWLLERS